LNIFDKLKSPTFYSIFLVNVLDVLIAAENEVSRQLVCNILKKAQAL